MINLEMVTVVVARDAARRPRGHDLGMTRIHQCLPAGNAHQ